MTDQPTTTIAARLRTPPFAGVTPDAGDAILTRAALRTWAKHTTGRPFADVCRWHVNALKALYAHGSAPAVNLTLTDDQRDAGRAKAAAPYSPRIVRPIVPGGLPIDAPDVDDEDNDAPAPTPDVGNVDVGAIAAAVAAAIGGALKTPAGISEDRVLELIKLHSTAPIPLDVKVNDGPRVKIDNPHKMLAPTLKWLASGAHVALVGPAGCGKTELAAQAAKALNLSFRSAGALDSKYALLGFIDAHGRAVRTPFRETFEGGGLFLLDEVDASAPSVPLSLNAALANGHCDFADANVTMHPDFKVIVAANTYGRGADRQYVGRNQLDASTLDRFAWLPVDYDEKLERALTGDDAWCDRVQALRAAARSVGARVVISMRASIRGARALAAGMTRNDVEEALIWKGMDSTERAKIEAATNKKGR